LGKKFGYETRVIGAVNVRGRMVSSSAVRRAVEAGDVPRAGRLLGNCFALEGDVVTGQGIGSKQTVPTLNLRTWSQVLPAPGVYITRTSDSEAPARRWNSITNVGHRPTFGGGDLSIETFLLDKFEEPSPVSIRVEFMRRVRDEKKFESPAELRAQIMKDVGRANTFFRRLQKLPGTA
jgi:riboflavin kinase/FMN adenylyltransferase